MVCCSHLHGLWKQSKVQKNGVEPEQVAVVITAESVKFLAETALLEAKAGKKCGKGAKKLAKVGKTVDELKGKVKLVKA